VLVMVVLVVVEIYDDLRPFNCRLFRAKISLLTSGGPSNVPELFYFRMSFGNVQYSLLFGGYIICIIYL
jgi:hypothetical protein